MDNHRKIISIILGILGSVFLAAAVFLIARQVKSNLDSQKALGEMRESAEAISAKPILPETDTSPTPEPGQEEMTAPNAVPEPVYEENPYRDSFLANKDMAAWLKIDDTVIDYPVMWTPLDENYYLYRSFEGKDDKNGCLILDTDSSITPLTTNLIIHGHNMKSGAMFGNLTAYEKKDYYENHKYITLYTETCKRDYEVIAVFRSQVYLKTAQVFKYYKFFQAFTEEEFDDFYQNIKSLSQYDTGVTAEFGDRFITLSTCVYHVDKGRFVVVAKEIAHDTLYAPFRNQGETNQPSEQEVSQ